MESEDFVRGGIGNFAAENEDVVDAVVVYLGQ